MNVPHVAVGAVYAFLFWQSKVLCRVEFNLEIKKCFSLICVTLLDLLASFPRGKSISFDLSIFSTNFPEWMPLLVLLVFDVLYIMIRVIVDHKS